MRLVTLVYLRRGTNTFTTGRCQFVSYNEVAQTLARFHLDAHISDVSSDSNECGCCRHTSLHQLPVESRDEGTCEWDDAWDRIYQWPYIIYIYIWSSLLTVFILLTLCLFCWCVYLYLTAHIFCLTAHTHRHTHTQSSCHQGATHWRGSAADRTEYFVLISTPIFQHYIILKNIKLYFTV